MGRASASASKNDDTSQEQGVVATHHGDRILYLSGELNEQSAAQVISGLIGMANQSKHAPVTLIVSTYGGSVDEMFSLYDVVKHVQCPVHTVGLGKVMSAGVLLLASGKRGCRMVGESARLMIHPIAGSLEGNVFQAKNEMLEFERQQKLMEKLLMRETSMAKRELDKLMGSGFDNYITAQQAVDIGIVDTIIGSKGGKSK